MASKNHPAMTKEEKEWLQDILEFIELNPIFKAFFAYEQLKKKLKQS